MTLRLVTRKLGSKLLSAFSSTSLLRSRATSIGFKEIQEEKKSRMVGNVFSIVASNYDLMNDLMSAGLHRLWNDRLVLKLIPFPRTKHLDVAGGTGVTMLEKSCMVEGKPVVGVQRYEQRNHIWDPTSELVLHNIW